MAVKILNPGIDYETVTTDNLTKNKRLFDCANRRIDRNAPVT